MADGDPTIADAMNQILGGGAAPAGDGGGAGTINWDNLDSGQKRDVLRQLLAQAGIALPVDITDLETAVGNLIAAQNNLLATQQKYGTVGQDLASQDVLDEAQSAVDGAQQYLNSLAGAYGGGAGGDRAISISRTINEFVDSQVTRTTAEQVVERQYLDVTTPEEFLNTFQNALDTHLQNLTQSGQLSQAAAIWLMDHPDRIMHLYLADLGNKAAAGQPVFAPAGVTGEPQLVGTRPGAARETQAVTTQAGLTTTQRATQQTQETAGAGAAGLTYDAEGNLITVPAGAGRTTISETEAETQAQQQKETEAGTTTATTEQIYARPNLAQVYNPSPTAFLQTSFTPQALEQLAAEEYGQSTQERLAQERPTAGVMGVARAPTPGLRSPTQAEQQAAAGA
jgi:hypothetical protein